MTKIRFDEGMHAYFNEGGYILPSVTQILGAVYGTGLEAAPIEFVERAAAKGTKIHKEIESYLKTGAHGETPEFEVWHKWFTTGSPITDYKSEQIVYAETPHGAFAGTADFFANGFIYDWKTSRTASREQVKKWQQQLSFYCYAMRKAGNAVNEPLKVVHVTAEGVEVINVDYLGDAWVEETMRLYSEGQKPETPKYELQTVSEQELQVLEDTLFQMETLKKVAEEIKGKIKAEMEKRGILDLQIGKVKMTYVAGTTRQTFDSKAFKAEEPALYAMYTKESAVNPSLRVTIK